MKLLVAEVVNEPFSKVPKKRRWRLTDESRNYWSWSGRTDASFGI